MLTSYEPADLDVAGLDPVASVLYDLRHYAACHVFKIVEIRVELENDSLLSRFLVASSFHERTFLYIIMAPAMHKASSAGSAAKL